MATNNFKPGAGKFASGSKFKGRGTAAGNTNTDKPNRNTNSERPTPEGGPKRPFREDRTAKFRGEGKKVYNRSERFTRKDDETGTRPFKDKRASFKSEPKFTKPTLYKSRGQAGNNQDKNSDNPDFKRERSERSERSEGDQAERPRNYTRRNEDQNERPRSTDRRTSENNYAARGERPSTFNRERKPYRAKPFGGKADGDDTRRPERPYNSKPGFDKPRVDRDSEKDRSYDRPARNDEFNRNADRPKRPATSDRSRAEDPRKFNPEGKRPYTSSHSEGSRNEESGTKRPYTRTRSEDDRSTERGAKRSFTPRSAETGEAPNYDLKRYQGRERRNTEKDDDGLVRLNRYIANAGICSRREADTLIAAGEIKVNGQPVTEMGYMVRPEDTVTYGKKRLNREKMVYVLLNKPKDFITTTEDPEGRKTVMDLVNNASKERIFPVGRLDRNTTGLLLFTNDGELAQKLTHPSNNVSKIYQVELDKPITEEHFNMIVEGVELEDGKAEVDDLAIIGNNNNFLGIQIHIGKNRIVRRIFEHLGYEVVSLDRVQYAGLTKKDLSRGKWRFLDEKEVIRLKYFL